MTENEALDPAVTNRRRFLGMAAAVAAGGGFLAACGDGDETSSTDDSTGDTAGDTTAETTADTTGETTADTTEDTTSGARRSDPPTARLSSFSASRPWSSAVSDRRWAA